MTQAHIEEAAKVRDDWAQRVRKALKAKERNQAWLAKKLGKDESSLSLLMNGDPRYVLSQAITEEIAKSLETPWEFLFKPEA